MALEAPWPQSLTIQGRKTTPASILQSHLAQIQCLSEHRASVLLNDNAILPPHIKGSMAEKAS